MRSPSATSQLVRAACLAACALPAPGATPYTARPLLDFDYAGPPPMYMPTAVAVAVDGTVFVADGVNDRVLQFNPQGELVAEVHAVGEATLSRPLGLKIDAGGRLWIADTGHQRVLVRATNGSLAHAVALEQGSAARPPDVTDLVPRSDGLSAWLVDNDNHRLLLVNLAGAQQDAVGELGESLGQFHYPFMIAASPDGDLVVSDVANARVQVLTSAGRPAGRIGTYGADLGELYRPKGVACDAAGNVWVSDSTLGAIQIFTATGLLRDVLRDPDGQPLKFDRPMGMTFDSAGNLYLVELGANRVRKLAITADVQAPPPARAPAPSPLAASQLHACTICHIEWLAPFDQDQPTALMDVPASTREQPAVSRPGTCLSCHDGSVVDSRRRVWQEHGHSTNVVPPSTMTVPSILPLIDGRLACRTCHSAHATGTPTGDISTAVFLRVSNMASELCVLCHPDKTRGPELGTHPTGGMPWPVPQALIDEGARVGPNPRELTCQVCHTPHGAAHEHLLVMGTESNQLCLTCHGQMRPGMFREGAAEHPLSPTVTPQQAAAVRDLGTTLGPGQRLICLTCHKLHHGQGQRFMLAEDLHDGRFCLRCHPDRQALLNTPHDLRRDFPQEKNRLGMTPEVGGPCSACHLFHRYARAPEASPLDPGGGKCITCHQLGRVAQAKVLGSENHTQARCTDCHNPHQFGSGNFLGRPPVEICARCHAPQTALAGGPHDVTCAAAAWPPPALAAGDPCLACHRPHGTEETGRFRVGLSPGVVGPDAACLACHAAAAPRTPSRIALVHPRQPSDLQNAPGLLPTLASVATEFAACPTCHDPHHAAAADPRLLRIEPGTTGEDLCLTCHTDKTQIRAIGHAPQSLRSFGLPADACQPCHVAHADPEQVELRLIWPESLSAPETETRPTAPDRYCVACHRVDGPVAPPAIATHPQVEMYNATPPGAPGYLPLFNERGEVDPNGLPSCRTCHLTHGRTAPAPLPAEVRSTSTRELRARQWHIREFAAGSVCTTCHGFDALRRFMYFHNPARRTGPLTGG